MGDEGVGAPVSTTAYNKIFRSLVGPAGDSPGIEGFVAYGLYKVAKREWVTDFVDRQKRKPNDAELDAYTSSWTASQLEGARERASQSLAQFAQASIDEAEPRILQKALKGNFWRSFFPSVVAALAYTVILLILAFILTAVGVDILGILENMASSEPVGSAL